MPKLQEPIVICFRVPEAQNFEFTGFYRWLKTKELVIYPESDAATGELSN